MFNFMKKKTTKTETPQQQAERDSPVDKVLLGYEIGTVSIATMVTGLERDGATLTLDLRLPKDSKPEVIQQELGQLLHPHGITTIHMNVRLPAPEKGSGSNLPKQMPKTTNAMESKPSHLCQQHIMLMLSHQLRSLRQLKLHWQRILVYVISSSWHRAKAALVNQPLRSILR